MALRLFNTLSRAVQEFAPLDPAGKTVGLYCCGPTVYDVAHIGNWRTFVFGDLVRRHLEFKGYQVNHVMNVTDVDDKIIKGVRAAKIPLREFTGRHEQSFLEDLRQLNCRMPHHLPHATDHIPDIVSLVDRLLQRGMAYQAPDGSIYFSIAKYRESGHAYGQLVKLNFDPAESDHAVHRVKSDEYAKEAVADFALWKARVPEEGEVFWPSPWGEGRPGWHIECSAMSMKLLGPSFDIHLGGEDLVFPHHEDEIAQSEGAGLQPANRPFVKYWLHGAHLLVEGRKMSKSLGNFFTVPDLLAKGFSGREIRYLLLTAHYRETFNFTLDGLRSARAALGRIDECLLKLKAAAAEVQSPKSKVESRMTESGTTGILAAPQTAASQDLTDAPRLLERFTDALDNDLNISAAWGSVFDWVRDTNRRLTESGIEPGEAQSALAAWEKIDSVLGMGAPSETEAPADVTALAAERQAARKGKDFKRADAIRDKLKAKGWVIEDTPRGPKLKRL